MKIGDLHRNSFRILDLKTFLEIRSLVLFFNKKSMPFHCINLLFHEAFKVHFFFLWSLERENSDDELRFMYKNGQGHLTLFYIVFVWLRGQPSAVRSPIQDPWFMYQNRLGPSGGIYYPNFVPCFVVLYLNDQGIIPFSTYLSGLKLLSYWVEPLSCLHSAHGPVLRQHVYYMVHKYSFQSPLNWHFWETLLNLFYPWSLWHLGLCHSWSYDRCGTCRLEFKRNWNTDDQKFHISYWTRSEKVKSWRKVILNQYFLWSS